MHINSSCLCALSVNGRHLGLIDRDNYLHIEFTDAESVFVSALPVNAESKGEKILPCALSVSIRGGVLTCESPCAALTSFPLNHYELTLAPERIYSFAPASALKQEKFNVGGEVHTATLIRDSACQLVCEGAGLLYTHVLPHSFSLKELSAVTAGSRAVIKAYGSAGLRGAGGEYAAFIAFDGGYALNLNLLCDKIEFEGNSIQTLTRLNDIARRGIVVTYSLNASLHKYEPADSYAVYLMNEALKPAHEALVAFAFFQAVKAGDFPEARSFMSASLSGGIDSDGALAAYFSDFDAIEENKYYPRFKNCAVLRGLRGGKNTAKLLVYKLDGDKKLDDIKIL